MNAALLAARLVLALVFVVAGLAKLADRKGSRQAVADFGVPAVVGAPIGVLLPVAELVVGAALLPASTAWWGALGALGLLVLFVVGISINLARGRKPKCHCFGQLHSGPAGWSTLGRNGVLGAGAAFVVWEGRDGAGPSAVRWLGTLSAAELGGLIVGLGVVGVLLGICWFLFNLLRQNGRLLVRLEALEARLDGGGGAPPPNEAQQQPAGLPVGTEAPGFSLQGLYGETLTLEALRAPGKPVVLIFTDPNCGPCNALLPEIGLWQRERAGELTISLISRGSPEENRAKSAEHGLTGILLQKDWEISEAYQVAGTPSAVLIGPDGKIASALVEGIETIRLLVRQVVGQPAQPGQPQGQGEPCPNCGKVHANGNGHVHQQAGLQAPKVGERAPKVKLPDLEGNNVKLTNFRGKETLVLFWNPGCGFCEQMLPDLKEWEANRPEGAPELLVISAGALEANKEMGLSSSVVLDREFAAGRAFGASGTPSAVLVDKNGRIASEVAVGAPAVLALAGAKQTEA